MITQWRIEVLTREQARIAEHRPDGEWCAGCLAVGYVEQWPCITVGTAELSVRQLQRWSSRRG